MCDKGMRLLTDTAFSVKEGRGATGVLSSETSLGFSVRKSLRTGHRHVVAKGAIDHLGEGYGKGSGAGGVPLSHLAAPT